MKLTIVPSDEIVYVDGRSHTGLSMEGVPVDVHALQWRDTSGWVEFTEALDGTKPANQTISELPQWALDLIPLWQAAEDAAQALALVRAAQPVGANVQTL